MNYSLVPIVVPVACGCVLPIMLVWLDIRQKMNESKNRTKIVLAAIEKNPNIDIEELLNKITPKKKLLKEKLLTKLLWGCLTVMLGAGLVGYGIYVECNNMGGTSDPAGFICIGLSFLGVGIAFLINYRVGRKMLANEIEAERQKLTTQA